MIEREQLYEEARSTGCGNPVGSCLYRGRTRRPRSGDGSRFADGNALSDGGRRPGNGARHGVGMGPGMGHGGMGMGMGGKWWKNSELVKKLGLSEAQVQQIEKTFQDHRLQLIDLRAALEKQEVTLQPLVDAERPDEAKVTAQIDQVAQARANLEKSNAKMLLAIRRILTVEQWKQLQAQGMGPMHGPHMMGGKPGPSK